MLRNFVAKTCDSCGHSYAPTNSRQKRCDNCVSPIRRQLAREQMARYRANNLTKVRRGEADTQLRNDYGITLQDYEAMYKTQNGKCAICGKEPKNGRGILRKLYVDHCHQTNRVRGLLCHSCNMGIGLLDDSLELLFSAIEYLKKSLQ